MAKHAGVRLLAAVAAFSMAMSAEDASATACGTSTYPFPYTDVAGVGDAFCPGIMEAYILGVTRGTTATTFSPNDPVSRTQMTTFLQRSIDQSMKRGNRRPALGQWWSPSESVLGAQRIALPGAGPAGGCKGDGERIWVANGNRFHSVHASTGEVLADAFFGPSIANLRGVLVANGRVYMSDATAQFIVPLQPKWDAPFLVASTGASVAYRPGGLAYDGIRLWTANQADGTITRLGVMDSVPAHPGTVLAGFVAPTDIVYDGRNLWVSEAGAANRVRKLDLNGAPIHSVPVGTSPSSMTYDGANLWVTNAGSNSITIVSVITGTVIATIAGDIDNALSQPAQGAFDGERILVTNAGNDSVTLFRAADLSLIGSIPTGVGTDPFGACSDGINFWVTLRGTRQLLRL